MATAARGFPELELIFGIAAIADALGLEPGRTQHLIETRAIPTLRLGNTPCARRLTLSRWLDRMEAVNGQRL